VLCSALLPPLLHIPLFVLIQVWHEHEVLILAVTAAAAATAVGGAAVGGPVLLTAARGVGVHATAQLCSLHVRLHHLHACTW
jgi:hypothetical protein